jgi:hypothetical protein
MFTILGITGNVGGATAQALLAGSSSEATLTGSDGIFRAQSKK